MTWPERVSRHKACQDSRGYYGGVASSQFVLWDSRGTRREVGLALGDRDMQVSPRPFLEVTKLRNLEIWPHLRVDTMYNA